MIREFRRADADAVAALLHEAEPPNPVTGAGVHHWLGKQPKRAHARSWVALEGDQLAGWMRARMQWATSAEEVGEIWGFVRPALRSRGCGSALYESADAHLGACGARAVESWARGDAGKKFLESRGFRPARRMHVQWLDLASANPVEPVPGEGFRLVPLGAVLDRARELHALDDGATADVPETFTQDDVRFEDWLPEALGHPQLTQEGSFVVLAAERLVAYTFLHVDPAAGLAANEMTGTHPDFRRRGLARLAKLASIEWARTHGYRAIITETDEENVGMATLNRGLGYVDLGTETQFLREDLS